MKEKKNRRKEKLKNEQEEKARNIWGLDCKKGEEVTQSIGNKGNK